MTCIRIQITHISDDKGVGVCVCTAVERSFFGKAVFGIMYYRKKSTVLPEVVSEAIITSTSSDIILQSFLLFVSIIFLKLTKFS